MPYRRSLRILLTVMLWVPVGACAPRAQPSTPTAETAGPPPADRPGHTDGETARDEPEVEARRGGTIAREQLLTVLDAGPGQFLAHVDVEPRFDGKRFAGWRILGFRPADRFGDVDLRPGDVVVSVNGQTLARPEHLQALWERLRLSSAIVVAVRRDGEAFELHFDVTGEVTSGP